MNISASIVLNGIRNIRAIVDGNKIQIVRKGKEKTIPIRSITSVNLQKPGSLSRGYIQFIIPGGRQPKTSLFYSSSSFDAAEDENAVFFSGQDNYDIALKIKSYIENYEEASSVQPASAPIPILIPSSVSVSDEIIKLKSLLDQGVLTQEEFDGEKRRLLSGLLQAPPSTHEKQPIIAEDNTDAHLLEGPDEYSWSCSLCGHKQRSGRSVCFVCGKPFATPKAEL